MNNLLRVEEVETTTPRTSFPRPRPVFFRLERFRSSLARIERVSFPQVVGQEEVSALLIFPSLTHTGRSWTNELAPRTRLRLELALSAIPPVVVDDGRRGRNNCWRDAGGSVVKPTGQASIKSALIEIALTNSR